MIEGTARLVNRRLRLVEVTGPRSSGMRRDTDRQLLYERYDINSRPTPIGFCFQGSGQAARFLIDQGTFGDEFLSLLEKSGSKAAQPYGRSGWIIKE